MEQKRLPRSTPEKQGLSSWAISLFLEELERARVELHTFLLVRHGRVVAEGAWAPYSLEERRMLYSVSKSFTATAIGLAAAEGKLRLRDSVASFFPDKLPADPSPTCSS
ncbi:serine hydrolase [Paenibacillus sp. CC-CFT747]|nr:serine hydrolase [Paenibacillus sp. CC-CFT747]